MQPEGKIPLLKYLNDALNAAQTILVQTQGLTLNEYYQNKVKWIIERGIEIISEALKRAIQFNASLQISDLNKIFAARNRIAHEYDIVDPIILYTIVNNSIPILIAELNLIIEQLEKEH